MARRNGGPDGPLLERILETLKTGFDGVNRRLDALSEQVKTTNARIDHALTSTVREPIKDLERRVAILEDRVKKSA